MMEEERYRVYVPAVYCYKVPTDYTFMSLCLFNNDADKEKRMECFTLVRLKPPETKMNWKPIALLGMGLSRTPREHAAQLGK